MVIDDDDDCGGGKEGGKNGGGSDSKGGDEEMGVDDCDGGKDVNDNVRNEAIKNVAMAEDGLSLELKVKTDQNDDGAGYLR